MAYEECVKFGRGGSEGEIDHEVLSRSCKKKKRGVAKTCNVVAVIFVLRRAFRDKFSVTRNKQRNN